MRSLQCLLLFAIIASIQCWSDNGKEKLKKFQKECFQDKDVDRKVVEEALANHQYPNVLGFNSFVYCLGRKYAVLDEDGKIKPDGVKRLIAEERLDASVAVKIAEKCSLVDDTPQQTAYKIFVCYQEVVPAEIKV